MSMNSLAGYTTRDLLNISDPRFLQPKNTLSSANNAIDTRKSETSAHPPSSRSQRSRPQQSKGSITTDQNSILNRAAAYVSHPSFRGDLSTRCPPCEQTVHEIRSLLPSVLTLADRIRNQEHMLDDSRRQLYAAEQAVLHQARNTRGVDAVTTESQLEEIERSITDAQIEIRRLQEEKKLARQTLKSVRDELSGSPHMLALAQEQHLLRTSIRRLQREVTARERDKAESAALAALARREDEEDDVRSRREIDKLEVIRASLREEEEALALEEQLLIAKLAGVRTTQR